MRIIYSLDRFILPFKEKYICIFLFTLALAIRSIGINHGYELGDERINDAAKVLTGQFIPSQHFYPPLFNYINALFFAALYAIGRAIPIWHDAEGFRAAYFSTPEIFYITARFTTSASAALVPPIYYMAARSLNISKTSSLIAACLVAILPISVYLSHIAKSDVPLATSTIILIYLIIIKYKNPRNIYIDIAIGVALAFAFSFKHSFLFIALTIIASHFLYNIFYRKHVITTRSIFVISIVFISLLTLFNIAIISDFDNFLTYQAIQTQISVRSIGNFLGSLQEFVSFSTDSTRGITIAGLILFLSAPFIIRKTNLPSEMTGPLLTSWYGIAAAIILVIAITGGRQQEGLWIPYFNTMHFFAVLVIALLLDIKNRPAIIFGCISLISLTALSTFGVSNIINQSLARPVSQDLSIFIQNNYHSRKLMTSVFLNTPQQRQAQQWEFARENRLAKKYEIEIPERSQENIINKSAPNAVFFVNRPGVLFGLESADDESMKGIVKAHAWPLQKEEWSLNFWLEQNINVFIVGDLDYHLNNIPSALIRNFYSEVARKCKISKQFAPRKPLFLETEITIFDCQRN